MIDPETASEAMSQLRSAMAQMMEDALGAGLARRDPDIDATELTRLGSDLQRLAVAVEVIARCSQRPPG